MVQFGGRAERPYQKVFAGTEPLVERDSPEIEKADC